MIQESRTRETLPISAKDIMGLTLFIAGFSLPLLSKWLSDIPNLYLPGIGLLLSTAGVSLLIIMTQRYERRSRRGVLVLAFMFLINLLFFYSIALIQRYPAPSEMRITIKIVEELKDAALEDSTWFSLIEAFENLSEKSAFQRAQVWWVYKVLSQGGSECEVMLSSLKDSMETNAFQDAEIIINALYQTFERIDNITSEFATFYVFLSTLALFFSTIIFLGGKAIHIGIPYRGESSGLLTYFYPVLLSFGLASSLTTKELYPLFLWVPYVVFMLLSLKIRGYDRATFFGFTVLAGGFLGAYTPIYPFSCLWYFGILCFFMLILMPSILPGAARDILLATSILAGCAGVNSAISMIFIHTNSPPSMALFSVVYDLISIIFALSEVSALPGLLGSSIKTVAREGFWPVLGFIISVLLLAFGLLAYFDPIPSLTWVLSLSLLCYVLIYTMKAYTLRRRRMVKYGDLGDVRALFLVSIPGLIFLSLFPTFYRTSDPLYLLLTNVSFSVSALIFIIWYIRGDRSLRDFLVDNSPSKFVLFAMIVVSGPLLCLLDLGDVHYYSLIVPSMGLFTIHKRGVRRKHLG